MVKNEIIDILEKEFGSLGKFFRYIGSATPYHAAWQYRKAKKRNIAIEFIAKNVEKLKFEKNKIDINQKIETEMPPNRRERCFPW